MLITLWNSRGEKKYMRENDKDGAECYCEIKGVEKLN